ncbi:hypothetical protein GCM10022381_41530 [Leifsonia kafniensis]|uniref:Uncharacterized protein n=1 Tax=Leifsonia kafniensis TaxID=475957 RepID=A0ABP7LA34_9MICO
MTFDPTAAQPHAQVPMPAYSQPQAADQQFGAPQPQFVARAPRPNPFVGVPLSDWVRDGGALLLLLISLALPWTIRADDLDSVRLVAASGRVEVILITLLSVFSLSLTYLARAGVFGPTVGTQQIWLFRLLANLPYFLLVVVYIVIDAVRAEPLSGLGYAAALGLAGAFLAAQPRAAEVVGIGADHPVARLWQRIALGYAVFGGLTAFAALIFGVLSTVDSSISPLMLLSMIVTLLFGATAVLVPLIGVIRGKAIWLTIARAVGGMAVGVVIINAFTGFTLAFAGIESLRGGGYLIVLATGLLGLASSPALTATMKPLSALTRWFGVASTSFVLIIVVAGFTLFLSVFTLLAYGANTSTTGLSIGTIVVMVAVMVIATIARAFLRSNPAGSQWLVLGLLGVIVVLGIVNIVIRNVIPSVGTSEDLVRMLIANGAFQGVSLFSYSMFFVESTWSLVLAFGLPTLAIVALTIPADVRAYYRQYAPVRQPTAGAPVGYQAAGLQVPGYQAAAMQSGVTAPVPGQVAPAQLVPTPVVSAQFVAEQVAPALVVPTPVPATDVAPFAPQTSPVMRVALSEAADPATSVERLFAIASENPGAWPDLAANPSTYPDLVQWLAQSPDPRVQQALRARNPA